MSGTESGQFWPAGLVIEDGAAARRERDDRIQLLLRDPFARARAVWGHTQVIGELRTEHFFQTSALGSCLVLVAFSHGERIVSMRSIAPNHSAQPGGAVRYEFIAPHAHLARRERTVGSNTDRLQGLGLDRGASRYGNQVRRRESGQRANLERIGLVVRKKSIVVKHVDLVQLTVGEAVGKPT